MNARQKRFVHEYLKDLNGKQAAIRAGYSSATAEVQASQLLSKLKVSQAIDAAIAQRAVRVEAKADDVVRELIRMATVDVGKAFDSEGRFLPLDQMPEDIRRAICSIEVEELFEFQGQGEDREKVKIGHLKKVKFWDKGKALEQLSKHLQLYDKDAHKPQGPEAKDRWSPGRGKELLNEIRKTKREREPSPDTEH